MEDDVVTAEPDKPAALGRGSSADIAVRGAPPSPPGSPPQPAAAPHEGSSTDAQSSSIALAAALSSGSSGAMTHSSSGGLSNNPSPFAAASIPFGDTSSEDEDEQEAAQGSSTSHDAFAFQAPPTPPPQPIPDATGTTDGLTFATSAQALERAPTPPLPGQAQQAGLAISPRMSDAQPASPAVACSPFSTAPGPAFNPTAPPATASSDSQVHYPPEDPAFPTSRAGSLVVGPPAKAGSPGGGVSASQPMTVKEMAKLQQAGWQAAEQSGRQDRISTRLADAPGSEAPAAEPASAPHSILRPSQFASSQPEGRAMSSSAPMSTPMRGSLSGLSRSATYGRRGTGRSAMASAPSSRAPGSAARQQSRTISQMLVDGVIAEEGMHLEGELPAHASGTSLDLKLLSRRNCPSLHLGDPPATVAAAVSSLQHVRLDNERLTDLGRGLLERLTAAVSLSLAKNQLVSAIDLGVLPCLRMLDLSHNQLTQVHGLRVLTQLAALDLSHNKLLSLEPTSLPGSLRFLQIARNPVTAAQPQLGQTIAAFLPMLRLVDGAAIIRASPQEQELELALMQHSKSDPGNEMAEALELSQINKSASLGNAPGFKRPPISPVRGSSSRKNLTADSASPPRDALLQAPSSSLPPLQDSAAAKSAAAPGGHHGSAAAEPFPERFDTSLPFQSRVSAAVKYLASQPVKPRKHAAASAGHMQPWPAATLVRQQLSQVLPSLPGMMDEHSGEAPDYLTRQLETYLARMDNMGNAEDASRLPSINPMRTATVIRARMALVQAVPKMLAAAKDARMAELSYPSGPVNPTQTLRGHPDVASRLRLRAADGDFLGPDSAALPTPQAVLASLEALTGPPVRMSAPGHQLAPASS